MLTNMTKHHTTTVRLYIKLPCKTSTSDIKTTMDNCNACKKILSLINSPTSHRNTPTYTELRDCIESIRDIIKNTIEIKDAPKFYAYKERLITIVRVARSCDTMGRT